LASKKIPVKKLVTHIFELGEVEKAFQTAQDVEKAVKVIVVSKKEYIASTP
jgi:threonine dehydrogenase-like Zn-dependent dehydrogenase